ncbi:hypothetical protein pb186bvf_014274 [Paramecium bursaria]
MISLYRVQNAQEKSYQLITMKQLKVHRLFELIIRNQQYRL